MIRKLIPLIFLVSLAGCAAPGTPRSSDTSSSADSAMAQSDTSTSTTGSTCDADPVQSLLGKKASSSVVQDALSRSHSKIARVVKPHQVVTMEYNPGRLNLIVDDNDALTSIHCG